MKQFAFVIFLIGILACTSETKSTPTVAKTSNPSTKAVATKRKVEKPIPQAPKPKIKSMVQEEKTSIEIMDNNGKVQKVEMTQPKVVYQNPVQAKPAPKPTPKPSNKTDGRPRPNPVPSSAPNAPQPEPPLANPPKVDAATPAAAKPAPPKAVVFSHDDWDALLRQHVSSTGVVNYEGLKADKAKLDAYTTALADNPVQSDWSRAKQMAYWINAYNAFTVKLIVDNYPISSITKLHGGKPWDVKWITLGNKTYSLDNIENDILRPQYKDARIHFAVNCAAKSCPPLLNRAWTASNLEANFEKQAKTFINNSAFNTISAKKVEVSKIFEWYAVDFGNLIDYLNQYANTPINSNAKIRYKIYNWDLNQ